MTDKPDVAALTMTHLLSWLPEGYTHCKHGTREWCESYLNNARDVIEAQAAELTRLAAERVELDRLWTIKHATAEELEAALATAKAEVARLRALLEPFAESAAHYEIFGIYGGVPVRHLRDARAALKPDTGEEP